MEVANVEVRDKIFILTMKRLNFQHISSNQLRLKLNQKDLNWWTPLWKGLVTDENAKHRKAIGSSIWLYLYLLTYTNRKSGIVRKKKTTIAQETGYPRRTIQRQLKRLAAGGYITIVDSVRPAAIRIEKWKAFNHSKTNAN